jgi:hypothetical protein
LPDRQDATGADQQDAVAPEDRDSAKPAGKRIHYFTDFQKPEVRVRVGSSVNVTPMSSEEPGLSFAQAGEAGREMVFFLADGATAAEDHPPGGNDYRAASDLDELWIYKGTVFDVDPRSLIIDLIDAHTHPYNRAADSSIVSDPAPLLAVVAAQGIGLALTMAEGPFAEQKSLVGGLVQQHPWLVALLWIEPATDSPAKVEAMVRDEGFRGLKFHPTISAYDADGPLMDGFLQVASKYGVPVQIHSATDSPSTPERIAALAKRFPDVKIVMIHTELGALDKNHALSVIQSLPNVYAETSWTNVEGIMLAMQLLDSSRVVFGTDATVDGYDHFTKTSIADASGQYTLTIPKVIEQVRAKVGADAFENWARLNAIRLYGLRFKGWKPPT